jgi:hypothetical protein
MLSGCSDGFGRKLGNANDGATAGVRAGGVAAALDDVPAAQPLISTVAPKAPVDSATGTP